MSSSRSFMGITTVTADDAGRRECTYSSSVIHCDLWWTILAPVSTRVWNPCALALVQNDMSSPNGRGLPSTITGENQSSPSAERSASRHRREIIRNAPPVAPTVTTASGG